MRIALVGYGKMGRTIEGIAKERGHTISHVIDASDAHLLSDVSPRTTDVVIEFTSPESAVENLKALLNNRVPVVCGTTGWLSHWNEITWLAREVGAPFFYASNFSVGVNLFHVINRRLAKLMDVQSDYSVRIDETHHTEKKDAPSGTALTIGEDILTFLRRKQSTVLGEAKSADDIPIFAHREPGVPGTHTVTYSSEIDDIIITHQAHNRLGFATGAVMAAEWLPGRLGIFGMNDLLEL